MKVLLINIIVLSQLLFSQKKLSIKEISNLINRDKRVSKKEIYNYCVKLKNEN